MDVRFLDFGKACHYVPRYRLMEKLKAHDIRVNLESSQLDQSLVKVSCRKHKFFRVMLISLLIYCRPTMKAKVQVVISDRSNFHVIGGVVELLDKIKMQLHKPKIFVPCQKR